jgi:hypothetical protein
MTGPMMRRSALAAALAAVAVGLTACSGDGVELNGRVFDWIGVSESAQKASAREPKLTERTGLVMPPDTARLPEPGSVSAEPDIASQINDPDRKRQMAAAERERLHKAYCSGEQTWKERARGGQQGVPTSPFGPCSFIGGVLKQ